MKGIFIKQLSDLEYMQFSLNDNYSIWKKIKPQVT
jgi:hypothetical protein